MVKNFASAKRTSEARPINVLPRRARVTLFQGYSNLIPRLFQPYSKKCDQKNGCFLISSWLLDDLNFRFHCFLIKSTIVFNRFSCLVLMKRWQNFVETFELLYQNFWLTLTKLRQIFIKTLSKLLSSFSETLTEFPRKFLNRSSETREVRCQGFGILIEKYNKKQA